VTPSQAEPPVPTGPDGVLDRALALVEFLRARCAWDAAQTPRSLQRYLLEEAHEVADAISADDASALCAELGDLLLNLAFQIVIGEEDGSFDRHRVVAGLEQKMRRRHPHLYGGEPETWHSVKARERAGAPAADGGILGGVPLSGEPLHRAHRIQERVSRIGFDWPDTRGAYEKVREEVDELGAALAEGDFGAVQEELGDLLFSVVNLARLADSHAASLLSRTNAKFARRFAALEALARERRIDVESASLETLDHLWDEAKHRERHRPPGD
jgi:MazG family protein